MTSPEGRWWKTKQDLGDALQENQELTRRHQYASARSAETMDLARQGGRTEAELELALSKLDLALLKDRRARSAHGHANEVARRRGAPPDALPTYIADPSLAAVQAEFDAAQEALRQIEQAIHDRQR